MYNSLISSLALLTVAATPLAVGPLALTATAQTAATETASEASFHSEWSALLGKYVSASEDGVNRFDYGALKANEADNAALNAYVDSFAALDITALPENEQYVAWINLYNAGTIQYIISKYPTKTIKTSLFGPWKKIFVTANGAEISLNDIEHEVLRKQWSEPRTHYAVNCASYGCPNLKASAWETATLEEDLSQAARAYINHPRGVSIRRDGRLEVSTIYKWFKEDFGTSEANVIAHFLEYAEADLAAQINARPDIKSYEYDWSLNDTN
jgi:hypothetical protein